MGSRHDPKLVNLVEKPQTTQKYNAPLYDLGLDPWYINMKVITDHAVNGVSPPHIYGVKFICFLFKLIAITQYQFRLFKLYLSRQTANPNYLWPLILKT